MGILVTYGDPNSSYFMRMMDEVIKVRPGFASTQKAMAIESARADGRLDGLRIGLANFATLLRLEKVRQLNPDKLNEGEERPLFVPSLWDSDFVKFTREIRERWDEWDDKTDEVFYEDCWTIFSKVVWDEEFNSFYETLRKDAVKRGIIEPTEEDRAWIEEEFEAYNAMVGPAKHLMDKLGRKKE
jgi:hypothetical protein